MKTDYQKQLDSLLQSISEQLISSAKKPTLLLHACCAPCSSYVLEYLADLFDITIMYYNPNIYPPQEYERRRDELINFLPRFEPAIKNKVKLLQAEYNPQEFYDAVNAQLEPELAKEAEKGERCRRCYEFRLTKAYEFAAENHFEYFCTTLSISPFKDAQKINIIGEDLASSSKDGPKWLPSDFKKKNGFKRSLELSTEYDLYRQQYCGCVFSKNNNPHKCAYSEEPSATPDS